MVWLLDQMAFTEVVLVEPRKEMAAAQEAAMNVMKWLAAEMRAVDDVNIEKEARRAAGLSKNAVALNRPAVHSGAA